MPVYGLEMRPVAGFTSKTYPNITEARKMAYKALTGNGKAKSCDVMRYSLQFGDVEWADPVGTAFMHFGLILYKVRNGDTYVLKRDGTLGRRL